MTKPTKWYMSPAKNQTRLAQSDQTLRCPHEENLGPYLHIKRTAKTLILDWADTQAGLSLRWALSRFVGFIMRRLIWFTCSLSSKV